jgi:NitT/TauT family transport system substrate-binding protein
MAIADPAAAAAALKKIVPEFDEQQAVEQFTASVPLMQNEVSEAEGTAQFDAERLETTWQWVARAQNLPSDSLDPKQVIANGFVE